MNLRERAANIKDGIVTLTAWLGDGAEVVENDLAQKRTDICIKCPLNHPGSALTESVAKAIKSQVELRNRLGLRTKGIKSLRTCSACSCYLPVKIFVPFERIAPDEEEKKRLDPACWLLYES